MDTGAMSRAVVVGAGPGGLAAAAMLRRAGVDALVLERSDAVAASWRSHYNRLHLHTVRRPSHLPRSRIPRRFGRWVARDDVVRYLEEYAAHHELDVRTGTAVTRIDRAASGWVLRSPAGDVGAAAVVVATGHNHTPHLPAWPGADGFSGELLHASGYRHAQPFAGRRGVGVRCGHTRGGNARGPLGGGGRGD